MKTYLAIAVVIYSSTWTKHVDAVACTNSLQDFTLVNADTNTDIMPLQSYSVTGMPTKNLNIRANPTPCTGTKVVDSVRVTFDKPKISFCEKYTPYTVFRDPSTVDLTNDQADYSGVTIPLGSRTVTATPYTTSNCTGTPGRKITKSFTVKKTAPTKAPTMSPSASPSAQPNTVDYCIDYVCETGYLLRENPETRPGNDRATCCYREGTCAGAPVGSACSLGDIGSSLIPNPSFEESTGCPTSFSQLFYAETWVQATDGTSDYWIGAPTCPDGWRVGLGGIGGIPQQATDGDAIVGSIKQGEDYYEYVGACLTSPLLAGVEYTFNLDLAAATNSASFGGDTNGVTELLCIPDCNEFQISGYDWKGDNYEILATAAPADGLVGGGEWKSVTFEVRPTKDCPAIMFGPGLDQSIELGQYGTYVLYDFLNLQEGAPGVCNDKGECVSK